MPHQNQHALIQDLAVLLQSGIPQDQAIALLAKQHPDDVFKKILTDIHSSIVEGNSLSSSLEIYNKTNDSGQENFSALIINMFRAGESSGTLPQSLFRLSKQLERDEKLKQKIRSSLVYPAILSIGLLISLIVLFVVVIPEFSSLLATYEANLNSAGGTLLYIAKFIDKWGELLLVGLVGLLFGGWFKYRNQMQRNQLKAKLMNLPVLRQLGTKLDYARLCHTLASLLDSGISQSQSLKIASHGVNSATIKDACDLIGQRLQSGETLGINFIQLPDFNPIFAHSISNSEHAGQLSVSLRETAERLESEFTDKATKLTQMIEPILILVLGVFIGLIVYALFSVLSGISFSGI
ncbi:MAG: type II secretion system F family protein [Gammaproteobacteria bacterium]|nr:type II secretion system F family protein [Gammaproteobacteria bacterium]